MKEQQLLLFRRGTERYGVPIEDVSGIISKPWTKEFSNYVHAEKILVLPDRPIAISEMDEGVEAENNKCAIIMHCNDIQIVLIVDEIIKEIKVSDSDTAKMAVTSASFQIWKLQLGIEDAL